MILIQPKKKEKDENTVDVFPQILAADYGGGFLLFMVEVVIIMNSKVSLSKNNEVKGYLSNFNVVRICEFCLIMLSDLNWADY